MKQHKEDRGQTGHGSHRCYSPVHCTPYLRMVLKVRETESERVHDQSSYTVFLSVQISAYNYLLRCVCVRVAAAVFSSSVMFCSVSSGTLHFSITTISISACMERHTLYSHHKREGFYFTHKHTHTHAHIYEAMNGLMTPVSMNVKSEVLPSCPSLF